MRINTRMFSYRFAEQVLNSKLSFKQEIETIIKDSSIDISQLSRPRFNEILEISFSQKGWESQPAVFGEQGDPTAKKIF